MAEKQAKICCMFSDPVPDHAAADNELECLFSIERSRCEESIYRCKKCGAYVLYRYQETVFYSGWDNCDIDEYYYPIVDPTEGEALSSFPENIRFISGTKCLHCKYREEDWKKDRSWFFDKT